MLEWRFDPERDARLPVASYDLQVIVFCSEGYTSSLAAAALQELGVQPGHRHGGRHQGLAGQRPAGHQARRRYRRPGALEQGQLNFARIVALAIARRTVSGSAVLRSAAASRHSRVGRAEAGRPAAAAAGGQLAGLPRRGPADAVFAR